MSYTVGVVWDGGSSHTPVLDSNDMLWWRWRVNSSAPCSTCSSRNGNSYPQKISRPHAGCSCSQVEDWRNCEFKGRTRIIEIDDPAYESVGNVPPDSFREFSGSSGSSLSGSLSYGGVSGGGSSTEESVDKTRIYNHTDKAIEVFAEYNINTIYYHDVWDCGVLGGGNDNKTVRRIETTFIGYKRSDEF